MEVRCCRKIQCTSYKGHVTNVEVCAKIQQAIGVHGDFLTIVKRCKLQWYSHVTRSSGLAKTILPGTVKGRRRQGRQRKRWEDNIREWTIVKRHKLQWYGHVTRSSGLAKTILQGILKGGRRQGRQRKRWEDNIREWTSLCSPSHRRQWRTGKDGGNWLRNHLWCPNDPRG